MIRPIFHLSVVLLNSFTLWYDQKYVDFPFQAEIEKQNLPFKNRVIFLTIWGLVIQTIYFTVSLLNDIFGSNAPSSSRNLPIIRVIKDTLFGLAFTIAFFVFTSFWAIYAVDRELIFPEALAKVFPAWANHVMHTTIAPFIILEMLLTNRSYPRRRVGMTLVLLVTLAYLVLINVAYVKTGVWVYPVLEVLNWPLRVVFFSVSQLMGVGLYILGEKLDGILIVPSKKGASGKSKKR